jgi:hypothetical protein
MEVDLAGADACGAETTAGSSNWFDQVLACASCWLSYKQRTRKVKSSSIAVRVEDAGAVGVVHPQVNARLFDTAAM